MNRASLIQAKFKARTQLQLPANKRFCQCLGKRFCKLLGLQRGFRPRPFSWIKCQSTYRGPIFPAQPFNWR